MKEADYYDVYEAARLLGLSPARVRQMLRAGELQGSRRESQVEGMAGPWVISAHAVHTLQLEATRSGTPGPRTTGATEAPAAAPSESSEPRAGRAYEDTPSEASELLSEGIRDLREKAKALLGELERLESRLETAEIQEAALRERLRREEEQSERLRAELAQERSRRNEEGERGRHQLPRE